MLNLYSVKIVTSDNGICEKMVAEENSILARREALRVFHLFEAESENTKVVGTITECINYDL